MSAQRLEKRTWSSSRVFGGHYPFNQKLVLFLCVCECVCVSVCVCMYLVYVCVIIQIYFLMCTRVVHSFTCWDSPYPVLEVLHVCWNGTCGPQVYGEG